MHIVSIVSIDMGGTSLSLLCPFGPALQHSILTLHPPRFFRSPSTPPHPSRFADDFKDIEWVRVPKVYREVTTPRVMTMEFVESFKLTDIERVEKVRRSEGSKRSELPNAAIHDKLSPPYMSLRSSLASSQLGLDKELLAKRTADSFLRQIVETGFFHCDPHPGNLCVDNSGSLVYYDFGMMDELKPNVREGFRTFCTALFAGGPVIKDAALAKNAKSLVDGVEQAGVLSSSADRLAVEKLARYFMRQFKDTQLGKSGNGIKETVGTDLQTLTENNVFRFPSTFTFIFRAFAR